jgi:hypothetical protein
MPHAATSKDTIAERYRRFATNEARGSSPLYEVLATQVASSTKLLAFLEGLPVDRRQPNLFFAAVRHVAGLPADVHALEEAVELWGAPIAATMQSRTTQTNEPGRCAVLLPVLAGLPQPLAILEVGASAGLCLLLDRYGYDYGRHRIEASQETRALAPIFPCTADDLTPLPTNLPSVAWRQGLDINPLSVASKHQMDWLETLVWPEQSARLERLKAAIEVARQWPADVVRGDLLRDVAMALDAAPDGMTRVVFHTAVLGYVSSQTDRDAFARAVREVGAIWISNEPPGVFPEIAAKVSGAHRRDRFLLAVDGEPIAWTGPHGQSIDPKTSSWSGCVMLKVALCQGDEGGQAPSSGSPSG